MIGSIAKSKNISEKAKMGYKNLKFFVGNSKNRLQKIRSGCRLANVIESQVQENHEVTLLSTLLAFKNNRRLP